MLLAKQSYEKGYLPIGIIRHNTKANRGNLVSLSFRSVENYDVAGICRKYGGGGYPQAAKMQINRVEFENNWMMMEF